MKEHSIHCCCAVCYKKKAFAPNACCLATLDRLAEKIKKCQTVEIPEAPTRLTKGWNLGFGACLGAIALLIKAEREKK